MELLPLAIGILLVFGCFGYSRVSQGGLPHFAIMLVATALAAGICYGISEQKASQGGFFAGIVGMIMMIALGIGFTGLSLGGGVAWLRGRAHTGPEPRHVRRRVETAIFYLIIAACIILSLLE